ncbi:hypothetical protein ACFQW5_11075 [Tsukamurella soli]|uniref:hypothetical protein n=1 Tax=Tsukamurella soli TaxID=644556 RepID=UPI0036226B87
MSPTTGGGGKALELQRMFPTMPVVTDIVPTMKCIDAVRNAVGAEVSDSFGSGVGQALAAAPLGISIDYRDKLDSIGDHEFIVDLAGMPSVEAAAKAVADPRVTELDAPISGEKPEPKTPVTIPGRRRRDRPRCEQRVPHAGRRRRKPAGGPIRDRAGPGRPGRLRLVRRWCPEQPVLHREGQ